MKLFYLLALVTFVVWMFLAWLGAEMREEVCIAGQVLTADSHVVLPVECS